MAKSWFKRKTTMQNGCLTDSKLMRGKVSQLCGAMSALGQPALLRSRAMAYPMLRNGASGPEIVLPGQKSCFRILIEKASTSALQPAEGRPEGRF